MNISKKLLAGVLAATVLASAMSVGALAATTTTDTTSSATTTASTTPPALPDGSTPTGQGGTPPSGSPGTTYSDVSSSAWYAQYVNFVTMRGIMSGTNGSFSPDTNITRGAFIEALYKAAGSPDVTTATTFTDVASSSEYYKAVCWAQANDIAEGTGSGSFSPNASLTREQAMTFFYRALTALGKTAATTDGTELSAFTDASSVSSWATTAMQTLVKMGVVEGNDLKQLTPSASLTNAQIAAMLYRVLGGDSAQPGQGGQQPGGSGTSSTGSNGTAATTVTTAGTLSGTSYSSTTADENALRIDGVAATLSGVTVTKTGDTTSQDNSNFYGDNAGILATNGATATITGANVTTNASGGNAVFSYGSGTTVNISNSTITTTKDNSGGIQTAGGGTTNAKNLTVTTSGSSAAAIRSDRGGGTVSVTGGTYTTNGTGSPAIYSTAAISVADATLTANNSEGIVVEGKNSVTLTDCDLTGDMTGTYNDSSENIHNIMIYQSMSGDADVGTAAFSATGGSITAKAGDMFYVTNTSCTIYLKSVDMTLANGTLLTVAGNNSSRGWGTSGKNGGTVVFTADDQTLTGAITCDSISSLTFKLTNASSYTGAINTSGQGGTVNVTVDSGSTWNLTGDCYVTSLTNNGTINFNGHTIYLADGSTVTA